MTAQTTAERQSNRRRRLNEAAQAMGYPSWGKYETAVLKGETMSNQTAPIPEPTYFKDSDDGFMYASVSKSGEEHLYLNRDPRASTEIPPQEWTPAEREFVAAARDEAAKAMAE